MEHYYTLLALGDVEAIVSSFELEMVVGQPFRLRIDAGIPAEAPPDALVGAPAMFAFGRTEVEQSVGGIGTEIEVHLGMAQHGFREIEVVIESQLALLRESTDCRIFQGLSVPDIVTQVLEEHGIEAARQSWQLGGSYEPRVYCVQWNETALAFVTRLCEAEGIFFFRLLGDAGETIVLSDDASSVAEIDGGPVEVKVGTGLRHETDVLTQIAPRERLRSGRVHLRDFAFETPMIDLEAKETGGDARDAERDLEQYAFARGFSTPDAGKLLTKVRLEALRVDRKTVGVRGRCSRLRAGALVNLAGAPYELDATYFVTRCRHAQTRAESGLLLTTEADLVPKDVGYRLSQVTPRPEVQGPGVGFVVAPDGSEPETVHTDEHGRVKVRFPWDRSGKTADDTSCWMRVAQLQTSGSLMLPRIGWEVLVENVYGDPDRPMVTGRVYNGATLPPYALPEGKSRTSLQSASSPGGGGRNEIRFEDAAGSEEISIEAQKSHTLATAGNKDTKVGANALQEVGGTRTLSVAGKQSLKITKGLTDGIKAAQTVIIGGSRTMNVNAARSTKSGAIVIAIGGGEKAMVGNPLQGALDLAAAMAKEAVAAKVAEAFDALDAAAAGMVDQVMAPVNDLAGQADAVGKAMADVGAGDVAALGSATDAAKALQDSVPKPSSAIQSALGGMLPAGWGGAPPEAPAAEGSGGGAGGGASGANEAGPAAGVGATEAADDACGPGHAILDAKSIHDEKVGGLRVVVTAGKVTTASTGARKSDAGDAKVELIATNRTEACDATKNEKAVGLVVLAMGNEIETIGGARKTKVGGAIIDKVSGNASLSAGGTLKMAGAYFRLKASGTITLKCGGSEVAITGGGIEVKSTLINLVAAKIVEKSTTAAGT